MHTQKLFVLIAILLLAPARWAWGLSIGTFNMEYFTLSGKQAYTTDDCRYLANKILSSGAQVVALQEVDGDKTMKRFVATFLPGWRFSGIDTPSRQDRYFIWRPQDISLEKPVEHLDARTHTEWKGKNYLLFRRPPLKAVFREKHTQKTFTMINIHLKSWGIKNASDKLAALAMNNGLRQQQILQLMNRHARKIAGPLFILGDFNSVAVSGADFHLFPLSGDVTYDDLHCTIDHIGSAHLWPCADWRIFTVETAIPRRAKRGQQHPDHDMVVLSLSDEP